MVAEGAGCGEMAPQCRVLAEFGQKGITRVGGASNCSSSSVFRWWVWEVQNLPCVQRATDDTPAWGKLVPLWEACCPLTPTVQGLLQQAVPRHPFPLISSRKKRRRIQSSGTVSEHLALGNWVPSCWLAIRNGVDLMLCPCRYLYLRDQHPQMSPWVLTALCP